MTFERARAILDMSDKKQETEVTGQVAGESMSTEEEDAQVLSEKIRDSARQIWLAGLGAYNKANEESEKFFDLLVKEG